MVLKDELIMLFQFYFNDFCRFRKRKGKDRRRRGKRAEGEGRRQLVYTPSKTDSPQEGGYPLEEYRVVTYAFRNIFLKNILFIKIQGRDPCTMLC